MSDFERIGQTEDRMFGPRSLICSGFSASEQPAFLEILDGLELSDLPVIFSGADAAARPLAELAREPDGAGKGEDSELDRAVVFGGVTEMELHQVMAAYREAGMPRPLWATLTEVSIDWSLNELLRELGGERAALEGNS